MVGNQRRKRKKKSRFGVLIIPADVKVVDAALVDGQGDKRTESRKGWEDCRKGENEQVEQ